MKLWQQLRSRQLLGYKFVRQEPIGPFFADFLCREKALVVEVDGGQQAESERDARREAFLRERGFRVIRFWNNDVLGNLEGVLETIAGALSEATPPHPLRFARRPLPASGR
jgi:very-short-patch-repair endonuclease